MSRHIDPEPQTIPATEPTQDSSAGPNSAQWKLQAFSDFIEDLVSTATGAKGEVQRDRLREDIELCLELDRSLIPLGLIFAASASMSRQEVSSLLSRLPTLLPEELLSSLDRVSETILMVDDPDIQASATIATSMLVQRSLPADGGLRDRMLVILMELVDVQVRERRVRHGPIFASFRQVERTPTLGQISGLISDVSDALEDLACDRDVFLDNPIELAPKTRVESQAPLETLKVARVQSGASLPSLSVELEQIAEFAKSLGWEESRGVQLVTELYNHQMMDTRSKLGLSLAAISRVLADLKELHEATVQDIKIEGSRSVSAPYSYHFGAHCLTLNVGYRGGLTSRVMEEENPKILEELKLAKADREATTLSKAIDRYRKARTEAGGGPISEDDEAVQIEALATSMDLSNIEAYDIVTNLYGAERIQFSVDPLAGISLQALRETVEAAGKPGTIAQITVDPEAPGVTAFRVDQGSRSLVLHSAFEKVTDQMIGLFVKERALEPFELVEPDEAALSKYENSAEAGSVASPQNIKQLIEEFGLSAEDAPDAFEVLLEDCPSFKDAISIKTLRVAVATINSRLGADATIDAVTGWCRDIPGTTTPDRFSVAWLSSHTEGDTSLSMLTFNFAYGEGKKKLPTISDELLLDWCRHYRVESRAEE